MPNPGALHADAIPAPTPPGWLARALRLPVLHKLWLANAVVVFAAAMAAGTLAARADGRLSLWVGAAVAAAIGALVHLHLLRLALHPVTVLVRAAQRVAEGDESARAPLSVLADPELEDLVRVFNGALESVAMDRQRLRDLAARAQDAQESERIEVARALHEGTVQTLSALLLRLRLARRITEEAPREALLDQMRDDLVEAIEAVRREARQLRPASLSEIGVEGAVEGYAREACAAAGVRLESRVEPLGDALSADAATTLYRVLQEAIDNAVRHADPESLVIRIRRDGGLVEAEVRDDGRGFAVAEKLERGRCLGLFAMEQRAARVGGTVRVESTAGAGTVVGVTIPATAEDTDPLVGALGEGCSR